MITKEQAKAKIKQVGKISDADAYLISQIMDRKRGSLTQDECLKNPKMQSLVNYIETRLAQDHLAFLAKDQVNGIWGGSTTLALERLAKVYNISYAVSKPIIGSDLFCALLDGSKSNEEEFPKENTYDWCKKLASNHRYHWDTGKMEINVIAIRGYLVAQGKVLNDGDLYNDTFFVNYIDNSGNKICRPWVASVDPGYYYYALVDISDDQRGCAHLVDGPYRYRVGIHINYPAGEQACEFKVARTNTPNYDLATAVIDVGWFGINNHSGYDFTPKEEWETNLGSVWNSSAGCQVARSGGPNDEPWLDYWGTVSQSKGGEYNYGLLTA